MQICDGHPLIREPQAEQCVCVCGSPTVSQGHKHRATTLGESLGRSPLQSAEPSNRRGGLCARMLTLQNFRRNGQACGPRLNSPQMHRWKRESDQAHECAVSVWLVVLVYIGMHLCLNA